MSVYVGVCLHVCLPSMWRSEISLPEIFFSFYHVTPEVKFRGLGLSVSVFTHCIISWTLNFELFRHLLISVAIAHYKIIDSLLSFETHRFSVFLDWQGQLLKTKFIEYFILRNFVCVMVYLSLESSIYLFIYYLLLFIGFLFIFWYFKIFLWLFFLPGLAYCEIFWAYFSVTLWSLSLFSSYCYPYNGLCLHNWYLLNNYLKPLFLTSSISKCCPEVKHQTF